MVDLPALDQQTAAPYHEQIASILREEITSGRLKPGDLLPSRGDLSAHFNVAHMTVGQAINTLRQEGWIVSRQGRGVFVRTDLAVNLRDLQAWSDGELRQAIILVEAAGGEIRVPERLLMRSAVHGLELRVREDQATGDTVFHVVRPK